MARTESCPQTFSLLRLSEKGCQETIFFNYKFKSPATATPLKCGSLTLYTLETVNKLDGSASSS